MSCRDVVAAFGLKSYSGAPRVYSMKMKPWLRKKFKEYEYKFPWSALGMTVTRLQAVTRFQAGNRQGVRYVFRGLLSPANRRNVKTYGEAVDDYWETREQEIISETSPNVLKFYENEEYSWTDAEGFHSQRVNPSITYGEAFNLNARALNGVTNRDLLKESDLSELQDNPFYEWKRTHDYIMTKNRIETPHNDSDDSDFDEDDLYIPQNPSGEFRQSWKGHLLYWLPKTDIFKTKLYYPNLIKESNPPHEDVYKIPFEREREEFLQFLMVFSSNFDNDEDSDWQLTDSTWLHSVKRFLFEAEKIIYVFHLYGDRIWFDYGDEEGNFLPEEPLDDLTDGHQLAHEISTDLIHNLIDWEFGEKNLSSCFGIGNGETGWYNIQRETSDSPQHGWIYPFKRYLHHLNGGEIYRPPNLIWNACMLRIRFKSEIRHMREREIIRQHRRWERDRQRELQRLVEAQVQESEAVQESPTETAEVQESPPSTETAEVQESQPPAPARHFYIIPGNPGNARLDLRGFSNEDANQVRQQLTTFLSDINVQNNTS